LFVSAIRPGFNTIDFPANDDGSVSASLGFTLNYFGNNYNDVYVNNNGNFTFGNALSTFNPSPLNSARLKIIAAFWADVDTRGNGSGIVKYGTGTVDGRSAFGATWINVGYFPSQVDKLNSFQIIFVDRSDIQVGDFDIELNYSKIQWEASVDNGGTNGLGGNSARVGLSDGASFHFELPGSGINGALIDGGSNALISNSQNSEVAGRYYFEVRNGNVKDINQTPVNTVPTNQTINENSTLIFSNNNSNQLSITDIDAGTNPVKVKLTINNGTLTLSGTTGLTFTTGTGTNDSEMEFTGTLVNINTALAGMSFNPTVDFNGNSTLSIETNDQGNTGAGGALTDTDTINIIIRSVNNAPSFTQGADQTVDEDLGAKTVNNWATNISAGPSNEASQTLSFTVTNDNNSLFEVQPAIDVNGNLSFTTAANAAGIAVVSVVLSDGIDSSVAQNFNIIIRDVNDEPINTVPATQTINENATLSFSSSNSNQISITDSDAGSNPIIVKLTTTNGTLTLSGNTGLRFMTGTGTNDAEMVFTGIVTDINTALEGMIFTPIGEFYGNATIQIDIDDQSSFGALTDSDTINITVNPVNDIPSFTKGADQTVYTNSGTQTIPNWATNISAGPSNEASQTLIFTVTNDNNSLFSIQPAIDANGNLSFTPTAAGSAVVTVVLSDGIDTSAAQNFNIKINAVNPPPVQQQPTEPEKPEKVNNPPTLENISNQSLKLGDSLQIQLNATDPDGNNLSFSLVDNPDGASINDGVLTWKADESGVFSFTVQVTDNGTPAKSDQKTFEVTVNEFEIKLKRIPNKTIESGETLEVTLTATTDQDDNNFTFSLVDSPDGASINDGVLTWKADKVGVIKFTVKVTHNGNSDEQTFEVTVTDVKFNLTTLISPINGGSIKIDPNKTNYDPDEQVKLTATVKDAECYEFDHWEGDCSGSECSLIMDADKTVTAHFIGKPIKLNITAKNGKVEPEKSEYLCGDKVELIAKPDENYQFLGWTGYVSTNKNPISLVLKEQENNLTAIFGPTTNLRISPAKVHAKVDDKLTFTATGSSNGNYFWETTQGETFEYEVTEEGIFYIWVTDGKGFAWSLVDSTSLENAVILIRFSEANLNLSVGDKQVIAVKAYDGKGKAKNILGDVVLESENPKIVQIMQNGQVTARGVGTTNLIATYQDKQAKIPVTVTAATSVLQVIPDNIILSEGDSQTVKIYEINQSGTKSLFKDAILNIRNTQFASVKNNVVTGMKKGSTWLDIVSKELSFSVPVIVGLRQKLAINPSTATIIKANRVIFSISGGKPPYKITATNGQILKVTGNNRFVYKPETTGTAKLTVIDSLNEEITATINIHGSLDVTPKTARITSQETVTLQAIGGEGNYYWTATKGQLSSLTDRRVEYTAPEKTGRYTVTIRDGLGNTKDILILVGEELLLSQQQLFLDPEESIELNILGGESPYTVEVDAGNVELVDSKINYKAPKVSGNYTLTVSDNKNNKVSAEIKVALDLLITPLSSRIDAGESLTLHAAGGFGEKRWVASKGKLDKTNRETVTWTAPDNFGPAIIYVMDAAGATAIANLEVASKGFAVTPSVRHVFPNKNANFTAVGGATPYTWIVEQGDFNAVDDETINYQAGNIRGSYKIEITDNSGKKAQAQVNVYSTKLFASPKILYINKGETLPITIGGGTGNYIVTSQLGKLADNQLKLEQDQRSITTGYTALQSFEGNDTINIFDTAGNLASIKVEIAKKDEIIAIYAGADGKVDEAEMSLAIDDFFAGQAWLDRTIMFDIADQFVD
jgi:membrane carboxypeptidase/penicillin-binding protein PbpC